MKGSESALDYSTALHSTDSMVSEKLSISKEKSTNLSEL